MSFSAHMQIYRMCEKRNRGGYIFNPGVIPSLFSTKSGSSMYNVLGVYTNTQDLSLDGIHQNLGK